MGQKILAGIWRLVALTWHLVSTANLSAQTVRLAIVSGEPKVEAAADLLTAELSKNTNGDQNFPVAFRQLALCYFQGGGVEMDEEQGLELCRKAADLGDYYAEWMLANAYSRGIGVPRDVNDAPIALPTRSSGQGYYKAIDELIFRYQAGLGTEQNVIAAARWYCRGASVTGNKLKHLLERLSAPTKEDAQTDSFPKLQRFMRITPRWPVICPQTRNRCNES
jgi:hypothetical protein